MREITALEKEQDLNMKFDALKVRLARLGLETIAFQETRERVIQRAVLDKDNSSWLYIQFDNSDSPSIMSSTICASDCSVRLMFSTNRRMRTGVALDTELSWSSTGRTLANATVVVEIYQRAVAFAAYCEAVFNR